MYNRTVVTSWIDTGFEFLIFEHKKGSRNICYFIVPLLTLSPKSNEYNPIWKC